MTYEERIRKAYPTFSKSFARLADFLLDAYLEAAFMTATELGHAINVDATTVVRFSQQLGYSGYPELLREIREKIKSQLLAKTETEERKNSVAGVIDSAMNELESLFEQTRKLLDPDTVERLADEILKSSRVVLIPDAQAAGAARLLQSSLERGEFTVLVAGADPFDQARLVHLARKNDLFIGFQSTSVNIEIASALEEAGKRGASTAAILGAASFESANHADHRLFAYTQPSNDLTAMILSAIAYTLGQVLRWKARKRFSGSDEEVAHLAQQIKKQMQ